ncbi:hypothetical protein RJ640_028454 [Escallonia rubra]|uniref:Uncharacterized protein n=1 Tax=Escallonia rubra TaxID=112253 RepID=A0AA88U0T2_9ASTE|nr:hypothetical protein RJ640_028454 [Escallonia rubra]
MRKVQLLLSGQEESFRSHLYLHLSSSNRDRHQSQNQGQAHLDQENVSVHLDIHLDLGYLTSWAVDFALSLLSQCVPQLVVEVDTSQWDQFTSQVEPIAAVVPYIFKATKPPRIATKPSRITTKQPHVTSSTTLVAAHSDLFVLQISKTLEDSLSSSSSPSPPPLQKLRDTSSESLLSTPWPSRKDEPFRFTDTSFITV